MRLKVIWRNHPCVLPGELDCCWPRPTRAFRPASITIQHQRANFVCVGYSSAMYLMKRSATTSAKACTGATAPVSKRYPVSTHPCVTYLIAAFLSFHSPVARFCCETLPCFVEYGHGSLCTDCRIRPVPLKKILYELVLNAGCLFVPANEILQKILRTTRDLSVDGPTELFQPVLSRSQTTEAILVPPLVQFVLNKLEARASA